MPDGPASRCADGSAARLPGGGRILALFLFTATIAGLVAGVYGPWMRVTALGHTGDAYTPAGRVQEILDDYRGVPILAVDRAGLRNRLAALPTVADAQIELRLPGELQVAITEKAPAFLWRTQRAVLVGARDGTIIAELPLTQTLQDGLRRLPHVEDERFASRLLSVGDAVPSAELRVAEAPDGARPEAHRLTGVGARGQGRLPDGLRAGVHAAGLDGGAGLLPARSSRGSGGRRCKAGAAAGGHPDPVRHPV